MAAETVCHRGKVFGPAERDFLHAAMARQAQCPDSGSIVWIERSGEVGPLEETGICQVILVAKYQSRDGLAESLQPID